MARGLRSGTITNLSLPVEDLQSIVWVLTFGVAAAVVAYIRQAGW